MLLWRGSSKNTISRKREKKTKPYPRCPTNQIRHCRARPQSTLLLAPQVSTNQAKKQCRPPLKVKKPDAWDKGGEYKDYKRTQPSGKPLTRLMKPNQNVKSITSVVVILLSLPAHLDYSSKERKERTRPHCTERKASLYQKGRAYRLQKGWLYPRVVILPYFVFAAIVAVVPFGIVSEVPGFLILL